LDNGIKINYKVKQKFSIKMEIIFKGTIKIKKLKENSFKNQNKFNIMDNLKIIYIMEKDN